MRSGTILVAGIGNIFFGDDAFGVEVAQELARRPLAEGVDVVDFGIRGLDLAYALLDDYAAIILVDAVPRGGEPGTLYVLEPSLNDAGAADESAAMIEPHALDPYKVLRLARSMGAELKRVFVVGCEPTAPETDDLEMEFTMEMSEPVKGAVLEAIGLVESLIGRIRAEGHVATI
jgi:hydrogenase maturation protease